MSFHVKSGHGTVEVFEAKVLFCSFCDTEVPDVAGDGVQNCPACEDDGRLILMEDAGEEKWWWWACLPGCLPDGGVNGPFETEDEALEDAFPEGPEEDEEWDRIVGRAE